MRAGEIEIRICLHETGLIFSNKAVLHSPIINKEKFWGEFVLFSNEYLERQEQELYKSLEA